MQLVHDGTLDTCLLFLDRKVGSAPRTSEDSVSRTALEVAGCMVSGIVTRPVGQVTA